MSKYSLDNLFGSKARLKVLKFVFRNYPNDFSLKELSERVQVTYKHAKKEIQVLESLGLIKRK